MDRLAVLVAGHVAEEIVFNEKTTGLMMTSRGSPRLPVHVTEYGMSDRLELRTFGHKEELVFLGREISEQRNYSERWHWRSTENPHYIQKAYDVAKAILVENKPKLVQIARGWSLRRALRARNSRSCSTNRSSSARTSLAKAGTS